MDHTQSHRAVGGVERPGVANAGTVLALEPRTYLLKDEHGEIHLRFAQDGVVGVSLEQVLAMTADRLERTQADAVDATALHYVRCALSALHDRAADRAKALEAERAADAEQTE